MTPIRTIGGTAPHALVLGLLAAFATVAPSSARAWDPLDPSECGALLPIPTPANLNICEYIVEEVIFPNVVDYIDACSCNAVDVGAIDIFDPKPWCFGRIVCATPVLCVADPTCLSVSNPVITAAGYIIHYDEVSCDFTAITPESLLKEIALEGFDTFATALVTGVTGGLNLAFFDAAETYLDALECTHSIALNGTLKSVLRNVRDDAGFDKEVTYFDADLDDLRLVRESDYPGGISRDGMTLGHLVIVEDWAFDVLAAWTADYATVQTGALCPLAKDALELIAHEAVHVRQYRNLGKQDFVQRYLVDAALFGYTGAAYEQEAYDFGLRNGAVDQLLASFEPVNGDLGCGPGAPPPTPPGTVATTPAAGGAPTVTIASMCGSFSALDCVPNPIECSGTHSAQVNLVGTATDPDGIVATEWQSVVAGASTTIATGTNATVTLASRHGAITGAHTIAFQATDGDSPARTAAVSALAVVHDTIPPAITINTAPTTYECNVDTYTEAGASAADVCDPGVSTVGTMGSVDTSATGTYTVTYSASDDVGNFASDDRTVQVVDTTLPTITAPADIVTQNRFPDLGTATATDLCTTPLVFNDAPFIFPYGTTVVTWWSRDAAGNESIRDTQTVTVLGGDGSAAGLAFSCGLSRDGEVFCWGENGDRQLGDGTTTDRWGPYAINMGGVARQVSVGLEHACAVKDDGTVQCWGSGNDGRLGNGSTADAGIPVTVTGLTNVEQVAAGGRESFLASDGHSCAVLSDGGVRCWGENGEGQLGDGSTTDRSTPVTTQMPSGSFAMQVTAGGEHSCAVDFLGDAYCWGEGADGRLGTGSSTDRELPTAVALSSTVTAIQINAGERHTCAVDTLGTVWCWGDGGNGRLGINSFFDADTPQNVILPNGAIQVSAGDRHTCAVLVDGRVYCWGSPLNGRLGDGSVIFDQLTPIQVAGINNAVQVSAGVDHTCARLWDGSALRDVCWGSNESGALGDGTSVDRATAVPVANLCETGGFFPPSAGATGSCIIGVGSTLPPNAMCWGSNSSSQLGTGTGASRRAPTPALGTADAPLAAMGDNHACAVTAAGGVSCWGNNLFGQVGDGTIFTRTTATPVADTENYSFVSTGGSHSCGITTTNQVKCWGSNLRGQVGDGTIFNRLEPTPVVGLPGSPVYLDLGDEHSCAVVQNGSDREVWCWGANTHGQLGNGFFFDSWVPVRAGAISDAWIVSAGGRHTCASTAGGPVYCWGHSLTGQVGNGSLLDSWVPVQVLDPTDTPLNAPFTFVSAGGSHTCAAPIGAGQQAMCWGNNLSGQLGNGSLLPSARAQLVSDAAFVSFVGAGENHTCARVGTTTRCWGENSSGQLGDGTTVNRWTPVGVAGACY